MHNWNALVRARLEPMPLDPARSTDIVDELAQHVAQHHADLVSAGVPDDDAVAQALAPLADQDRVAREIARADRPRPAAPIPPAGRTNLATDLWRDVRYATRLLMRTPGFSTIAIVTLALGIGANTAIFSVVNAVLLRPQPYRDPGRLVMIGDRGPDGSAANVGYATFLDWRDRSRAFDEMAVIRSWNPTLITDGGPERISGMRVSSNYFHLLGIQPAVGRDFHATEDNPNDWRVVLIISYSVAERTREIGIRAALGASRTDIVRLVLGGGLGVVAIGVAAGVAIALAATRYLHGSLYNVSATDPSTIAVVAVALFAIAAIAQGVPMARAMRVEPSVALRHD